MYNNKIDRIIGKDASPMEPAEPTFPGYEDSPFSPGKNGSCQASPALISDIVGMISEDDSRVFAIERFSLLRYEDDGKSLLPDRIGASVSALTETVGATIKEESSIKKNNIRSLIFILYIFRLSVFLLIL